MFRQFVLPLVIVPLCGCSLLASILENTVEAPTVVCQDIQLRSVNLSGLDLVFSINAYNPNAIGLDIGQVEYSVAFDGNLVGRGQSDSTIPLRARENSQFELDFSVDYSDLLGLGINALTGGSHTVAFDAVVHVATPLGDVPVRVGHSVEIGL